MSLEEKIMNKFLERRNENSSKQVVSLTSLHDGKCSVENTNNVLQRKISILLENINLGYDYTQLENVDNIYIPLKFF